MDATLNMKLADQLFEIADRLEAAERARPLQPESQSAAWPAVPDERRDESATRADATSDALRRVTRQPSKVSNKS